MVKMKKGSIIPDTVILKEEYKKEKNNIIANIDVDKIHKIIKKFIDIQNEELFLFIEIPTNLNELENKNEDYIDIYYKDGLTSKEAHSLLKEYGEILINDGLCKFGFGTKSFNDEIMSHKYNIVTVFSKNIDKYDSLFSDFEIKETNNYKCAWDFFRPDSPGISNIYEKDGKTVFDIIEELKDSGLYLGERKKVE